MIIDRIIKVLFFAVFVKPLVFIALGLNLRGYEKLPAKGPALIAANHNSHLDTLVLMSLFPLSIIHKVRPVAAADYFLGNSKFLRWFSLRCIGIIPFDRSGTKGTDALFNSSLSALDNNDILILFPEGSRGKPETMGRLKKGIYYLLKDRNDTKVTPVMLYGLGRALPKGEALFVPFNCDVAIGDAIKVASESSVFLKDLTASYEELTAHLLTRNGSLNLE